VAGGKKNARRRGAWLVFEDESGVSERPAVRRTWAPRGETPVLTHAVNWKQLSVATALAFRWDGQRSRLYFQTRPGSYSGPRLLPVVRALKRHFRSAPVILIWDRLPAHRSRALGAYLLQQRRWLSLEWLPGYAPELNPVEYVWGNLKGQELANLCAADLGEAGRAVHTGMTRIRRQPQLPFAFLNHAGLSF